MIYRIIIAGAGGQGIMMMGKVLAEAGMREGRNVTYLPAYGAEVRGGTANCMVVISDGAIGSPLVQEADILVIMNEPSLVRFSGTLSRKGLMLVNSSLVPAGASGPQGGPGGRMLRLPFTEIAIKAGNQKAANMAALGSFCAAAPVVSIETVAEIIEEITPPGKKELFTLNKSALDAGKRLIEERGIKNG